MSQTPPTPRAGPIRPARADRALAAVALAAALALAACGGAQETRTAMKEPDRTATATEPAALDAGVLAHPSRTEDDRRRDEGFKPLEVYGFFGVEPGMTVADLWPGRGYNTHLLSLLVGEQGRVLAVLGPIYTRPKYVERIKGFLNERIEAGGLSNVKIIGPLAELTDESVDVMITVRNYHDLGEAADRTAVLPDLMRALRPGGILGVVDAYTPREGRDEENHRINEDLVIREITSAGFELVGRSDILYNPDDTYDFDGREDDAPIHRYFIHRFVHKYRKPA